MICSKCGFQNNPGDNFCRQCGEGLATNNPAIEQPIQVVPIQQNANAMPVLEQPIQVVPMQQNTNNNSSIEQSNQIVKPQYNINNNQQINNTYDQQNVGVNAPNVNVNNPVINNGTYKLTLNRPKSFVGSVVKYKIAIDDNEVGAIKNGETVSFDVSAGQHIVSFNNSMDQNINITCDTTADVVLIAGNQIGLSNIKDSNGQNIQNNELYTENADKIIKESKRPLIVSCSCIVISIVLLYTIQMIVSAWVYGISIGYAIVNLSSTKKYKQTLNDKYKSIIISNIIAIVISIIGAIISISLTVG